MRVLGLAVLVWLAACRPALMFVPAKLPQATVGKPYQARIEVRGGETPVGNIWAGSMPPGLVLTYDRDRRDGIGWIHGTPTVAGRSTITVEAWCYGTNWTGQTGAHEYELVVR